MALENDLGRDDIKRLVWRIAIPSMLSLIHISEPTRPY